MIKKNKKKNWNIQQADYGDRMQWVLSTKKIHCDICKKNVVLAEKKYFCIESEELLCFDCALDYNTQKYMNAKRNNTHVLYRVELTKFVEEGLK